MGAGWCLLRAESEYGKTRTKLVGQPHGIVRSKNKVPSAWASLGVLNCLEAIFFYRMLCVVMFMFSRCCLVPTSDLAIHCSKQQLHFLSGVACIDWSRQRGNIQHLSNRISAAISWSQSLGGNEYEYAIWIWLWFQLIPSWDGKHPSCSIYFWRGWKIKRPGVLVGQPEAQLARACHIVSPHLPNEHNEFPCTWDPPSQATIPYRQLCVAVAGKTMLFYTQSMW